VRGIGRGECVEYRPYALSCSFLVVNLAGPNTNRWRVGEEYPEDGQELSRSTVSSFPKKPTRTASSDSMFPDSRDEML
jgi:hypothetical protein